MRPGVRVVKAHVVHDIYLKVSGYNQIWHICRLDSGDDDAFNCIEGNGADWRRRFHYCAMPLSEAEDVTSFVFYPVGSASEAWAEWRATGLARVVMLHDSDGSVCPWDLGPVWERRK